MAGCTLEPIIEHQVAETKSASVILHHEVLRDKNLEAIDENNILDSKKGKLMIMRPITTMAFPTLLAGFTGHMG